MEFAQKLIGSYNIDPKLKYQNPSSSGSKDIVLTRFFNYYNGKGHNSGKKQSSLTTV